ncbi:MAG: flagellin lysine-N-methylase [Negativicutes bacterium]|nr:flagellin lysine-N-methylase [Negativicutes bacterium]
MFIYLDIYEQFTCQMCGTCCRNDWAVTVDEASYRRNAALFKATGRCGEFRQAFTVLPANAGPGEYAFITKQPGGGCWFLDSQNLCRLHKEAGHEHLDAVCQTFPRYPMNTARGIEITLSFSCPAVLDLATRNEPLKFVRADSLPGQFMPQSYAAEVHPRQQISSEPLRYYFELEQHFIDILQCRTLSLTERLEFLQETVGALARLACREDTGVRLNELVRRNYTLLDSWGKTAAAGEADSCTADVLTEHFFVNFVFKKTFYLFGLQRTMKLLDYFWRQISGGSKPAQGDSEVLTVTQATIRELEFQFFHNRRKLMAAADI